MHALFAIRSRLHALARIVAQVSHLPEEKYYDARSARSSQDRDGQTVVADSGGIGGCGLPSAIREVGGVGGCGLPSAIREGGGVGGCGLPSAIRDVGGGG